MGIISITMALGWCCKAAIVCIAFTVVAHAAEIEHDIADERGDIDYRISFKTKDFELKSKPTAAQQKAREDLTSTGKFTIEIVGSEGTTGPMDLIDRPSQTKDLGESNGWKIEPGMVQVAKINAADVGEIQEIKVEGDSGISLGEGFSVRADSDPGQNHFDHLYKCTASFCNNKSEKRYAAEGDDEPSEHEHSNMFGPLGEGMPGTEHDHTMTRGHFMREFLLMENVEDDDEDFLRTHSV